MRIRQLDIENFRGVVKGTVTFPEHGLLVGPNNVGKSTVLEALDLALGPDRLSGATSIDEHDFHMGRYLPPDSDPAAAESTEGKADEAQPQEGPHDGEGEPPKPAPQISITVTLGDFTDDDLTKFRSHVEVWNAVEARVYTHEEAATLTPALGDYVLRVRFRGRYDADEDEFQADTIFVSPQNEDGSFDNLGKKQKQSIGFLYLRALRTGRRAATLQRGSLLDVLLNVADAEPRFWQDVIDNLVALGEATSKEPGLRAILDELEQAMEAYVPGRQAGMPPSRLNVTQLTREQLRTVMTYFMTDRETGHVLPFDRLGSGMTNLLVLALLTLIAQRKKNVIFAMEEPEIALGPTVQRRIVAKLKAISTQTLLTSHSPYVAEQMLPDSILVLRRKNGELTSACATATAELKEKILRQDFRKRFAEGLLGNAVIIVEGDTELHALPAASEVLARLQGSAYRSLDVLGVVPVWGGSDGELTRVASFFSSAGLDTYVFCDSLNDATVRAQIAAVADDVHEHPHSSFEKLLSKELELPVVQRSLKSLAKRSDYTADVAVPADGDPEEFWREALRKVLEKRKGHGYAAIILKECAATELPISLRKYLGELHAIVVGQAVPATDPLHALLS